MAAGSDRSRSGEKQKERQNRKPKAEPLTRSENMSRIRGKDTQPEMTVRRAIWAAGLRYRLHDKRLPGSPDLVFPGQRTVVFVHGCFWHCHDGCKDFRIPKTRTEWWAEKLARNKARDSEVRAELEAAGWHVFVIWECEVVNQVLLNELVSRLKLMPKKHEAAKYL
ncbi:very short patch repair endonuclease [Pseudomonas sp. GCM10022186]|uniref:very short patch repair endonuclease n=1 Tax=Pseudomonas sp. GCM10022186 TaxID=3252650 RepID=UPI00360DA6D8